MDTDWNEEAAARAAIRDEVERVLRKAASTLPQCHGPCDQGRKLCPCPEACERGDDDALSAARGVIIGIACALAIWAGAAALWLSLR